MRRLPIFLFVFLMTLSGPALFAGAKDIRITGGPWHTPVCYQYGNYWFGTLVAPTSLNGTYFWGYEIPSFTYPVDGPDAATCSGETGRGFVYGTIANLASYSTIADYKSKIKTFPSGCSITANGQTPLFFSTSSDSILYANCNGDGTVKSIDLSAGTPSWTTVCNFVTGLGKTVDASCTNASDPSKCTTMFGFVGPTKLYGSMNNVYPCPPGYTCDHISCNVSNGAMNDTPETNWVASKGSCKPKLPDEIGNLFTYGGATDGYYQIAGHGHGATPSNSGDIRALFDPGIVVKMSECEPDGIGGYLGWADPYVVVPASDWNTAGLYTGHVDWHYDTDYFIGDLVQNGSDKIAPAIMSNTSIAQYYFNTTTMAFGTPRKITYASNNADFVQSTARGWINSGQYPGCSDDVKNWHSGLLPSMGIGGNTIAYTATNGKYSLEDHECDSGITDWEPGSMWIATISIGEADPAVEPSVTTVNATSIAGSSFVAGGEIVSAGGGTIDQWFVAYAKTANPTVSTSTAASGTPGQTGSFSSTIIGLEPCTTYHYRAGIHNSAGYGYGADTTVKTFGACVTGDWTAPTPALVASTSAHSVANGAITTSAIDTTGATLLVVGIAYDTGGTPNVYDSLKNSWTALTVDGAGNAKSRLYYSIPTSVGAGHTFTQDGANTYSSIFVLAFRGTLAASAFDQQNTNHTGAAAATVTTGSVTPTTDNQVLAALLQFEGASTDVTIDSTFTRAEYIPQASGYYGGAIAWKVQPTAGAENPTWTVASGNKDMSANIATFKPSASGSAYYTATANKPYSVKSGGTPLTHVADDASCPASIDGNNKWCHVDSTDRLYVQTDGTNPGAVTIGCSAPSAVRNLMLGVW